MDRIVITGGRTLNGKVSIAGAKNAALPLLASTLLSGGDCVLSNLPQVRDVTTMIKLLGLLGVTNHSESDSVTLNASMVTSTEAPYDLVKNHAGFGARVRTAPGEVWKSHGLAAWWMCYRNKIRQPAFKGVNGPWR